MREPNSSKLSFYIYCNGLIEALRASNILLNAGNSENTFIIIKKLLILTTFIAIDIIAMSAASVSSIVYSLRYLKTMRVYSSRYLQWEHIQLTKLAGNLVPNKTEKETRTCSRLCASNDANKLDNPVQVEPPNKTEAKAIEEIFSIERSSQFVWASNRVSFTQRSLLLFSSM